jgi:poly(3-hydroxyalkanoate) synthetase
MYVYSSKNLQRKRNQMFTKQFWIDATERAAKTFAQFYVTLAATQALDVFTMDWKALIGVSVGGALLSYATSLVSAQIGVKGTPSLVKE